jgi:hypothetical protein
MADFQKDSRKVDLAPLVSLTQFLADDLLARHQQNRF